MFHLIDPLHMMLRTAIFGADVSYENLKFKTIILLTLTLNLTLTLTIMLYFRNNA